MVFRDVGDLRIKRDDRDRDTSHEAFTYYTLSIKDSRTERPVSNHIVEHLIIIR